MFAFDTSGAPNARFALFGSMLGCVWITVSLRISACTKRSFTWDDGFCLLSALLFTGFCTTALLVEVHLSGGYSDAERRSALVALSMTSTELYVAAIGLLKVSIGLFYLRHLEGAWQRYTVHTAIAVNIASSVLVVVATALECGALLSSAQSQQSNTCLQRNVLHIIELATSVSNAASSWTLTIIPVFIVAAHSQHLSIQQKGCTGCAILLGGCASVMSILRLLCVVGNSASSETYLVPLSVLEFGIAIIAASAVTLQPPFSCLARPVTLSDYISYSGSETTLEKDHEHLANDRMKPIKSHFSLFSEASGPRTWFNSLRDESTTHEAAPTLPDWGHPHSHQRSIHKIDGKLVISKPVVDAPPPLNRTESQQYLLRDKRSDSILSSEDGRRHVPLFVYGGED
ncbi:uncharacterized protein RCC_05755 [Ramularia collo-cygni]|uniref:Rhodopsin domain-containing protein n=1 Tax=Ramularia collo-cygni TaxID=112498 RepID=A0A2D3VDW3_9PEZI|nr:uncharacterized protein RCC_05755 [Ramularia collo-cygni]CZT19899.1 uncharacterized protein RCC_05755 [Ramularia collo-cygni]